MYLGIMTAVKGIACNTFWSLCFRLKGNVTTTKKKSDFNKTLTEKECDIANVSMSFATFSSTWDTVIYLLSSYELFLPLGLISNI